MCVFFFSSRRRHTRCALVTGVQTCALPILAGVEELVAEDLEDDLGWNPGFADRSASNEGGQQHRGRDPEPGPPPAPPAGTCARERGLAHWPTSNSDSARATVSNPKIERMVALMA